MINNELVSNPRIAVTHDWLVTFGGAERVLLNIIECFPEADLFSIIEFLPRAIKDRFPSHIRTTFIQKLPFAKKLYWYYCLLMPLAVEQIDLSKYDIVLSSSHCFAKGVLIHPHQLHISHIHSPARFIWDLQFDYYKNFNFRNGVKRILVSVIFHFLRIWDARTTNGVDIMISNSKFIQRRVLKCYRRSSVIIHPGIDTSLFSIQEEKQDYYLAGSFMNPFKKLDLIVQAFSKTPERKLLIFGYGPQNKYLRKIAGKNITFLGKVSDEELVILLKRASAFVFAATEDFGMIMAEAQACGTPVIAYNKGGASEIIIDINNNPNKPTGVLFKKLTTESLIEAIEKFEINKRIILPINCRNNSLRFDTSTFKKKLIEIVQIEWGKWLFDNPKV